MAHQAKDLELSAQTGRPILPGQERYPPPQDLKPEAAAFWVELMDAMPGGWFGRESHCLLRMLCRHMVTQEILATKMENHIELMGSEVFGPEDAKEMKTLSAILERQTRVVAALYVHLRLTPTSRGEHRKKDQTYANPGIAGHPRPWSEAA